MALSAENELTGEYVNAWRSLAGAAAALSGHIEDALAAEDLPPLAWYEILDGLAAADEQSLRMGELSDLLPISKGGMTKLVDRIAASGYVERRACATDRRVSYVALTDSGAEILARMRPIYTACIDEHLATHLSATDAALLSATLDPVRGSVCEAVGNAESGDTGEAEAEADLDEAVAA